MRTAIVHDWLVSLSGAERVLLELHKMFPEAPIYTLFHDKVFTSKYFPDAEIRSSFLQRIPLITKRHKYLFFLMPTAIESFDLSDFDLVISSSAIFSKGLVLKPRTRHICYCYSPTRQLWDLNAQKIGNCLSAGKAGKFEIGNYVGKHFLRLWDRQASDRVDEFVAISKHVQQRIWKYYRRNAKIIYPPCDINSKSEILNPKQIQNSKLKIENFDNYYLIVSRLYLHKNIDVAIEAFNKLNLPLVIIGTGPEQKRLRQKIENNRITMLGFIADEQLPYYYLNCRAFILPQEEDFGITPIEAMSFGKPVLALRKGGAIETIMEGVTGEFFDDPIAEGLADGIRRLEENYPNYNSDKIKLHSQAFLGTNFRDKIMELINYK